VSELTLTDVYAARRVVGRYLPPTPLVPAPRLSARTGCEVYVKCEQMSPIRSFKARGAIYCLSRLRPDQAGVACASTGNHGQGVAFAAGLFGKRAVVVVPRSTTEQKMVILDVPPDRTEDLVEELDQAGLPARPSAFRRHTMACTGIEFCKLAIVETKARAVDLIAELERRLPDFDAPVTINVNGCPNSCARIQTADIGLKGSLVTGPDGTQVEGFQVHLGGSLNGGDGSASGFGRKVRGLKATAEELPDYVERVLRRFRAGRAEEETFAAWTARATDEELS